MGKIRRILVANRGEIALRIIRACRELGIETVQAYSEADRESLPVQMADDAVCIGPAHAAKSYLNIAALVSAALISRVDAIHPGYGFLSENADFAELCKLNSLCFIGPNPEIIRLMGDKAAARELAMRIGVPTIPGSDGSISDLTQAISVAKEIGFPILLKAAAGGGGRGMRVVYQESGLLDAFQQAQSEARAAFGNNELYIERYLTNIRHIEIQIIGDGEHVLHIGERDCTIQRRHQKLVEESPSPAISEELRNRIAKTAVLLARHVGYTSVGTLEFVLDQTTNDFYFIEMNTRIQVEHPVTEMISGVDLVKEQILIASNESLSLSQDDISLTGHAIECRINAEDVQQNFKPNPGAITRYLIPGGPGIRVDSHIYTGYTVPPYYDSLIAKVIAWGNTRTEAIKRMQRALRELVVEGITTTADFHQSLINNSRFLEGKVHTQFVEQELLCSDE